MTSTNTATQHGTAADRQATAGAKAVLFCPHCEFQDAFDGAWDVGTDAGFRVVHCPRCRTRIA